MGSDGVILASEALGITVGTETIIGVFVMNSFLRPRVDLIKMENVFTAEKKTGPRSLLLFLSPQALFLVQNRERERVWQDVVPSTLLFFPFP